MPKKILVIEDEIFLLKTIESRLKEKGYEVLTAINGIVALEKVQEESIDLILVDVEMPQMNGYTFVTKLKELKLAKSIPIVVMTDHQEMQEIFKRKGVKEFLDKPILWDKLLPKIQQLTQPFKNKI